MRIQSTLNRRQAIQNLAAGTLAAGCVVGWPSGIAASGSTYHALFRDELEKTPPVGPGPFFPDKLPLDTDNDLIVVNDSLTPAIGEVTHLSGKILNQRGNPIRNATVEIWECDHNGVYLHTQASSRRDIDANFQGFGRFLTDSKGRYYFRTIKPIPYASRKAPHIHFAISVKGKRIFTTEMLIKGHPGNAIDPVQADAVAEADRHLLMAEFQRVEESRIGEWTANFDIVLGNTPQLDD